MSGASTPFTELPPKLLPPSIRRFDAQGRPTLQQLEYEQRLNEYLKRLIAGFVPLNASALPTANPHVAGEIWSNAGVLSVSAG
jgi:hypothetical protein